MRTPLRPTALVLALALASMASACPSSTPDATRSLDISLDYAGPTGIVIPPSADSTCQQHWAPINLDVSTDWLVSVPLTASDNGHYSAVLRGAPVGSHWIVVYDVQLCPLDPLAPPVATTGIRVGGTLLTRETTTPGGGKAMGFTVDAFGGVRP